MKKSYYTITAHNAAKKSRPVSHPATLEKVGYCAIVAAVAFAFWVTACAFV